LTRQLTRLSAHERFMRSALTCAKKGLGSTSPNPAVGAVITNRGRIISRGWHRRAGGPHAEIEALAGLGPGGSAPRDSVMYVTLEPCCHHGRTPPCTDALISSGIRKVVIGAPDPNPKVAGGGVRALSRAGIEVVSGVLEPECTELNEAYNHFITTGRPFVTVKLAVTLDGRIATSTGESRWITGERARAYVHRMRARNDAVMVGANTVAHDDPSLTVRSVRGADPLRVVVDSGFATPLAARMFLPRTDCGSPNAVVFTTRAADRAKVAGARELGVDVAVVKRSADGVDLGRVVEELGAREVTSLLVEGGGTLSASLIRAGLVQKLAVFIAPAVIGGDGLPALGPLGIGSIADIQRLRDVRTRRLGADICVEGLLERQ